MSIPIRYQVYALGELLKNHPLSLSREQLDEDFQFLWDVINQGGDGAYSSLALLKSETDDMEMRDCIDAIMAYHPDQQPVYESLADIAPTLPEVEWLWEGWLPRGLITMMAAWPGVGKTYVALDLANRLISRAEAPDGQPFNIRNPIVIYVDAEDFLPVVNQRVAAWGMNRDKFIPIQRPPKELIDMGRPEYQDLLRDMCYKLEPDLVIVDSLSSVNSRGENNIEDLREVMGFFTELPKEFRCAFILIHHLRKRSQNARSGGMSMHDLRGSGHLVAMARVIIGLDILYGQGEDEDMNGPRILKGLKNNLSKYPKPLTAKFEKTADPAVARLVYTPLSHALIHKREPTEREITAEWLVQELKNGPAAYAELKKALKEEFGYHESTLQKIRKQLGSRIIDTKGPRVKGNKWALNPET